MASPQGLASSGLIILDDERHADRTCKVSGGGLRCEHEESGERGVLWGHRRTCLDLHVRRGRTRAALETRTEVVDLLEDLGVYAQVRAARRSRRRSHQKGGGRRAEPEPPPSGSAWPARPRQQLPEVQHQHRLKPEQVRRLIRAYRLDASVPRLVKRFEVHSTTVARHLELAGVARRGNVRKLTEGQVQPAGTIYRSGGVSLAELGRRFGVSAEAMRQEFKKAGVRRRPPGRPRSSSWS